MADNHSADEYAKAGVNIDLGDHCSKILYNASKETWANRKGRIGEIASAEDAFGGLRFADFSNLPDAIVQMNFDGIGTKVEVAERLGKHDTMAFDLLAMVCDDAAVRGTEPILAGSVLDCHKVSADVVTELADGLVKAAKVARVAIMNGELAELGDRIGGYGFFSYNWASTVMSVGRRDRILSNKNIKPGQTLIGFAERGFRSNGFSLVRRILSTSLGKQWHTMIWRGNSIAELVLTPSIIYTPAVVDMFGGFAGEPKASIVSAVHVTGGGVPGKLGRALRTTGLGANVDDPFEPPPIMYHLQKLGNVPDRDAYRTWNMGQGMIVITESPQDVLKVAEEHGIEGKAIGNVVEEPGIRIRNKGVFADEEADLFFEAEKK